MPKFPEPPEPASLRRIGADIRIVGAGTVVWRIFFQAGKYPTTWDRFRAWGPTRARFDHHLSPPALQDRKILYGAIGEDAARTAIAEAFQNGRVVNRTRRAPGLVSFVCTREIRLLDLTSKWPTRAGASMAISSVNKARARRWSQAMYAAFPEIDGLMYASSMNANEPSVALYEGAMPAMPVVPLFLRQLSDPTLLPRLKMVCGSLNYTLV